MTTTAMRARILAQVEPILLDSVGLPRERLAGGRSGGPACAAKQPDGPLAVRTDSGALLLADPQWHDAWQDLAARRSRWSSSSPSWASSSWRAPPCPTGGERVRAGSGYFLADRQALTPVPSRARRGARGATPARPRSGSLLALLDRHRQPRLCRPGGRPRDGVGNRLAEPGYALGDRRRCPAGGAGSRSGASGGVGSSGMDSEPRPARALHHRGVQHPLNSHRPFPRPAPPLDDHQAGSPAIRRAAGANRQPPPRRRAASLLERLPGVASDGPPMVPPQCRGRRVPSTVATGEGQGGGQSPDSSARGGPSPRQRPPYPSRAR